MTLKRTAILTMSSVSDVEPIVSDREPDALIRALQLRALLGFPQLIEEPLALSRHSRPHKPGLKPGNRPGPAVGGL
jgi:hypothetical protein